MRAQAGDWLVIERADIDHEARRGLIEEVRSTDGTPPYLVRWLDTGREALVFPGPDAHVQAEAEHAAAGARASDRAADVQRQIAARRRGS
jgi:hypothetical protein